jgi:hypothetical protein
MASANDFLVNAERLISDAEYLIADSRARSAATLTVVALEQMGAFVEALTIETYPDAKVHMGIFGSNANLHAKRQDALAGHVFNFVRAQSTSRILAEAYIAEHGSMNPDKFVPWMLQNQPYSLTEKQQEQERECPDIAAGNVLMHFTRTNVLKDLREYGFYENTNREFSDALIRQTMDLAKKVRAILSKSWVVSEPLQLAGVNLDPATFPKIK